jgi:CheY-like chemotaxis protein
MSEKNANGNLRILVVEDNEADVFLLKEAISLHKLAVEMQVVENGALAIAYIENTDKDSAAPCPCLCLLDMNLPLKSGADVLKSLRDEIMRLGASAFFHKPISYSEFMDIGNLLRSFLPETPAA